MKLRRKWHIFLVSIYIIVRTISNDSKHSENATLYFQDISHMNFFKLPESCKLVNIQELCSITDEAKKNKVLLDIDEIMFVYFNVWMGIFSRDPFTNLVWQRADACLKAGVHLSSSSYIKLTRNDVIESKFNFSFLYRYFM